MEIEQLDNENNLAMACLFCPSLRSHRATHSRTTRRADLSRAVDYLCPQATARALGLPLWRHLPIDVLGEDELGNATHYPRARRNATEHQLTEAELALVREPSPAGEVTRRATPIERLAANIHGLVTGHADPTPAALAKLIREAITEATIARMPIQSTDAEDLGCAFEHDGQRCGWSWPEHPTGSFFDGRAFPMHSYHSALVLEPKQAPAEPPCAWPLVRDGMRQSCGLPADHLVHRIGTLGSAPHPFRSHAKPVTACNQADPYEAHTWGVLLGQEACVVCEALKSYVQTPLKPRCKRCGSTQAYHEPGEAYADHAFEDQDKGAVCQ